MSKNELRKVSEEIDEIEQLTKKYSPHSSTDYLS